jgi:hypothetical protein
VIFIWTGKVALTREIIAVQSDTSFTVTSPYINISEQGCPTLNQCCAAFCLRILHMGRIINIVFLCYIHTNICSAIIQSMKCKNTNVNRTHSKDIYIYIYIINTLCISLAIISVRSFFRLSFRGIEICSIFSVIYCIISLLSSHLPFWFCGIDEAILNKSKNKEAKLI